MATLGELLNSIKNTGLNAKPTGESPYTSENVAGGTDSPMAQPGIDDFSNQTKTTLGSYLSKVTAGEGSPGSGNAYPVSPNVVERTLIDPSTGNPAPLNKAHQTFNKTYEEPSFGQATTVDTLAMDLNASEQRALAFALLDQLGFFDKTDDVMDKNDQASGHNLLNSSAVKEKISSVLTSNRFNAYNSDDPFVGGYNPDGFSEFSPNYDWYSDDGQPKDHPQIEKIKQISEIIRSNGVVAREALPDFGKGVLDASAQTKQNPRAQQGINVSRPKLDDTYGEIDDSPEENPRYSKYHKIDGREPYGPNNLFGDLGSPIDATVTILQLETLKVLMKPGIELMDKIANISWFKDMDKDDHDPNKPWMMGFGRKHAKGKRKWDGRLNLNKDGKEERPDTSKILNSTYNFLHAINIPVPKLTIRQLKDDPSWSTIAVIGLSVLQQQIKTDSHAAGDINEMIKQGIRGLGPDNNFGLPEISAELLAEIALAAGGAAGVGYLAGADPGAAASSVVLNNTVFLRKLKECYLVKFLRACILLTEAAAAGNMKPDGSYAFSGLGDVSEMTPHPSTRLAADMGRPGNVGLATRNVPSMMLLPKGFIGGMGKFHRLKAGKTPRPPKFTNKHTNTEYQALVNKAAQERLAAMGADAETIKASSLNNKLAGPIKNPDGNRFSSEVVKAMENVLEAELLPFYFHDLRTNEIVSFHAFLNALSDSFSPSYNASSGFGRIEDVQIYQKTTRAINLDFTVMSVTSGDMQEMYYKLNKLISMVYPQFSRGTLLELEEEQGVTRFVQPFSQVTTATPVIRIRVGDLIKSNYSREAMSRLMGIDSLDYRLVDKTDPEENDTAFAESEKQAWLNDQIFELDQRVAVLPLDENGQIDKSKGWPIGSIVLADPPYDGIPVYDPETMKADTDKSAKFVTGMFGCKIKEYYPVSNPVHGPGTDCFVRVEIENTIAIEHWPEIDHIATRSDGTKITECLISYTDINRFHSAGASAYAGVNDNLIANRPLTDFGAKKPDVKQEAARDKFHELLFTDSNPMFRSFETSMGRGLAGVITSLNFDWGLNSEITWDLANFGYKAPMGCKVSIAFTPIHDITPGLDHNGMLRAPVFNVADSGPHPNEDPHNDFKGRMAAGKDWVQSTENKAKNTRPPAKGK